MSYRALRIDQQEHSRLLNRVVHVMQAVEERNQIVGAGKLFCGRALEGNPRRWRRTSSQP